MQKRRSEETARCRRPGTTADPEDDWTMFIRNKEKTKFRPKNKQLITIAKSISCQTSTTTKIESQVILRILETNKERLENRTQKFAFLTIPTKGHCSTNVVGMKSWLLFSTRSLYDLLVVSLTLAPDGIYYVMTWSDPSGWARSDSSINWDLVVRQSKKKNWSALYYFTYVLGRLAYVLCSGSSRR